MDLFAQAGSLGPLFPLSLHNFVSTASAIMPARGPGDGDTNAPGMNIRSATTVIPQIQLIARDPARLASMPPSQKLQAFAAADTIKNNMGLNRGWEAFKSGVGPINATLGVTGGKTLTPMGSFSGLFDPSKAAGTMSVLRSAGPALQNLQRDYTQHKMMVVPITPPNIGQNPVRNMNPIAYQAVPLPHTVQDTAAKAALSQPGGVSTAGIAALTLPTATGPSKRGLVSHRKSRCQKSCPSSGRMRTLRQT